jgi:hypothetical protein
VRDAAWLTASRSRALHLDRRAGGVADFPGPLLSGCSQAEAAVINAEQASQALEQRYTALSEEHGKARAARCSAGAWFL